ncbi:MAG: hypothetical protein JXR37_00175 [Kiritimatiellae bacterium]|nr:hypothetical protein [Kiritimatiellia bacterium]
MTHSARPVVFRPLAASALLLLGTAQPRLCSGADPCPVEGDLDPAYRCALAELEFKLTIVRRTTHMTGESGAETNGQFRLSLLVHGPGNRKVLTARFPGKRRFGRQLGEMPAEVWEPTPLLTAVQDSAGIQLVSQATWVRWQERDDLILPRFDRNAPPDALGLVSISDLSPPSPAATALARVEGVVLIPEVQEEETVVVKPLAEYLNTAIALDVGTTVTFTRLSAARAHYSVRLGQGQRHLQMEFFDGNGGRLQNGRHGQSGGKGEYACHESLRNGHILNEGAYAVVRCPLRTRVVRVPFSFRDVPLP